MSCLNICKNCEHWWKNMRPKKYAADVDKSTCDIDGMVTHERDGCGYFSWHKPLLDIYTKNRSRMES